MAATPIWEDTVDSDSMLEKVYGVEGQELHYSPTHWLPSSIWYPKRQTRGLEIVG